jgi:hypothetical protein
MKVFFGGLLCFALLPVVAQTINKKDEFRKQMWELSPAEFKSTEVPEKWKEESAVIIARANHNVYKKIAMTTKLMEQTHFHQRVKIQSQKALEEFSQFKFNEFQSTGSRTRDLYFGYKVVKPDGQELIVPDSDVVREEVSYAGGKFWIVKIAIPNLEIGDILDYYWVRDETFFASKYHFFDPAIFTLRARHPIVHGRVSFAVLRHCYINLKTYNGAPSFEASTDDAGETKVFLMKYADQEKAEDIPWHFPYRTIPTVKFRVTFATPMTAYQLNMLLDSSRPGEIKSTVGTDELSKFLKGAFNSRYDYTYLSKHMAPKGLKDQKQIVKEAYFHQRNQLAVQNAESRTKEGSPIDNMSGVAATINMSKYFVKKKIPHDIIVTVSKNIGALDDIIVPEELHLGIRVNLDSPIYLMSYGIHALPGEIDPDFMGNEAYYAPAVKGYPMVLKRGIIPVHNYPRNSQLAEIAVSPDLSESVTEVHIKETYQGISKEIEQNYLMDVYDFLNEEKEKFGALMTKKGSYSEPKLAPWRKQYQADRVNKLAKVRMERAKMNWLWELDTVMDFSIVSTGRTLESPDFICKMTVTVQDVISSIDDGYLVHVGKLLDSQRKIEEEHRVRSFPVYSGYPRSFAYHISIDIPEGYVVEGFEALNVEVTNSTGGFRSEAVVLENQLIVKTFKYYANIFEPAENWPMMLAFLDVARDFNESKVLLKKVE